MSQLPRPKGGIPVRSGIPQPASRLPQPSSRLPQPTSRIPGAARPSGIAKPTLIGKTVQESIVAHRIKQQNAQLIKQRGTYGNIVRADQLLNAPKVVPTQQVDKNMKDYGTRIQQKKLEGIVKKFGAQPIPDTAFIPADVVQSQLTHRKVLQQVSSPSKRHERIIDQPKAEEPQPMSDSMMGHLGVSREDPRESSVERQLKLNKKLKEMKHLQASNMCKRYAELLDLLSSASGPEKDEKKRIAKIKYLENVESELHTFLAFVRLAVGKENYLKYKHDETDKKKFIKSIRDYFANNPNPNNCKRDLKKLMQSLPMPTKVEQPPEREPMSPLAALKKPISNLALGRPPLPGPSRLQQPASRMQQPSSRMSQPSSRMPQPSSRMPLPSSRMPQPTQQQVRPPSAPARTQRSPSPAQPARTHRSPSPAQPAPARPTTPRSAGSPRTPTNVQRPQPRSASPMRPHSTPHQANRSTPVQGQRRPHQPPIQSPVEKIREKVSQGLKQLQVMKNREKNSTTIKQKLSNLTKRFCAIYAANHNKTRAAGFEVWSQAFMKDFNSILADLEDYYNHLPHVSRAFNKSQIAFKFSNFLYALYDDTKRISVSRGDCEKMVGDRISASAELARLKKLQGILKEFVQQIQELLGPFVPEDEEEEESEVDQSEAAQARQTRRAPVAVGQPIPRIEQLRAMGAGLKPVSKVPSKTMHRRPQMRPRAELQFSPIPPPTPQPRRTPERVAPAVGQMKPQVRVTPPTNYHVKAPVATAVDKSRLAPQSSRQAAPVVTPDLNTRISSPFNRSFDQTPKYLKDNKGLNKSIQMKKTRLDMIKRIPALDLVQKLSDLEERVQRATSPTYRPISAGSPGRDNMPFDRTYTAIADTSFQSAEKKAAAPGQGRQTSQLKQPQKIVQQVEQDELDDGEFSDGDEQLSSDDEKFSDEAEQQYFDDEEKHDSDDDENPLCEKINAKWSAIEKLFCSTLTNPELHHIKVEAEIDILITDLKNEIIDVLYGWNDEVFAAEMETVEEDFLGMNKVMRKFLQKVRDEKVSLDDCQNIISGEINVQSLPKTDIQHQLFEAYDHLEFLKDRYRRKIADNEAQGHLYGLNSSVPNRADVVKPKVIKQRPFEIRENDGKNQSSEIFEDESVEGGDMTYYYDAKGRAIEIKKRLDSPPEEGQAGPSRFVKPSAFSPESIEDTPARIEDLVFESSESSDEDQVMFRQVPKLTLTDVDGRTERLIPKAKTFVEALPEFVLGLSAPDLLIERDILHVACQLTEREPTDLPLAYDNLTKSVLESAKAYKQGVVHKDKALELIGKIFWRLPCVPIEFTNTFIYHPTNSFFGELVVNDPATNAAIRANLMNQRAMHHCEDSKADASALDFSMYAADQTWFNIFKDEEADEIAKNMEESMKLNFSDNLNISLGDVSIEDCELSNSGDDFFAIPSGINFSYESVVITDEEQMSLLNAGGVPDQNIVLDTLRKEMDELDGRLDLQFEEGQRHIDKSAIYARGIKQILHPTILERHNYWQARGSDVPSWFPGMYTVFEDSADLKPFVHNDTNNVFLHAWRTMAPHIEPEAA